MPLSYNRSAFSASVLNDGLSNFRTTISNMLPPDIKQKSTGTYSLFSNIDIDETSDFAPGINNPEDVAEALNTIARRDGFAASFNFDVADPDFATGSTISLSVRTLDQKYASGGTNLSFFQFDRNLRTAAPRKPEFYRIGSSVTVGVTTDSFSINRSNNSGGWFADSLICSEDFSIGGSDGWFGAGTGATLMIETFGQFKNDEGSGQWDYGSSTRVGKRETFDDGWPYVVPPQSSCSGSASGSEFNENLSSQITGANSTFSTSNQYVSGTLRVYWNGQRLRASSTGQVIETGPSSFATNFVPSSSTELIVDYIIK